MFKNREPRFNIVWATFSWHQVHSRGDRLPEMAFRSVFKVWNGPLGLLRSSWLPNLEQALSG